MSTAEAIAALNDFIDYPEEHDDEQREAARAALAKLSETISIVRVSLLRGPSHPFGALADISEAVGD